MSGGGGKVSSKPHKHGVIVDHPDIAIVKHISYVDFMVKATNIYRKYRSDCKTIKAPLILNLGNEAMSTEDLEFFGNVAGMVAGGGILAGGTLLSNFGDVTNVMGIIGHIHKKAAATHSQTPGYKEVYCSHLYKELPSSFLVEWKMRLGFYDLCAGNLDQPFIIEAYHHKKVGASALVGLINVSLNDIRNNQGKHFTLEPPKKIKKDESKSNKNNNDSSSSSSKHKSTDSSSSNGSSGNDGSRRDSNSSIGSSGESLSNGVDFTIFICPSASWDIKDIMTPPTPLPQMTRSPLVTSSSSSSSSSAAVPPPTPPKPTNNNNNNNNNNNKNINNINNIDIDSNTTPIATATPYSSGLYPQVSYTPNAIPTNNNNGTTPYQTYHYPHPHQSVSAPNLGQTTTTVIYADHHYHHPQQYQPPHHAPPTTPSYQYPPPQQQQQQQHPNTQYPQYPPPQPTYYYPNYQQQQQQHP
ncbi:hypothetical protein DFA_00243 [Cavenderia fasciculata]|uniref:Uncharacterized protein n=1 Tax=Cavenderia fasciculata TaxID=261658 RepID=F4PY05_CACFS|nr:uncharacterized protein DFA_00243 [Cavenderia fasciculata]EGG19665.1 hypothetical protein DFA_00243 [Cavenderia fasciculata]|eukprot:XP_004357959.1 hypothetical protein DFA_00243 [Cavenderia fasciculata]